MDGVRLEEEFRQNLGVTPRTRRAIQALSFHSGKREGCAEAECYRRNAHGPAPARRRRAAWAPFYLRHSDLHRETCQSDNIVSLPMAAASRTDSFGAKLASLQQGRPEKPANPPV